MQDLHKYYVAAYTTTDYREQAPAHIDHTRRYFHHAKQEQEKLGEQYPCVVIRAAKDHRAVSVALSLQAQ